MGSKVLDTIKRLGHTVMVIGEVVVGVGCVCVCVCRIEGFNGFFVELLVYFFLVLPEP